LIAQHAQRSDAAQVRRADVAQRLAACLPADATQRFTMMSIRAYAAFHTLMPWPPAPCFIDA